MPQAQGLSQETEGSLLGGAQFHGLGTTFLSLFEFLLATDMFRGQGLLDIGINNLIILATCTCDHVYNFKE